MNDELCRVLPKQFIRSLFPDGLLGEDVKKLIVHRLYLIVYADTLKSRNASLSDTFLSVLSLRVPMIRAQGT